MALTIGATHLLNLLILCSTVAPFQEGGPTSKGTSAESIPEETVRRGLEFLRRKQNEDGSWGKFDRIATTSMVCLSFMSGSTYGKRGKDAAVVAQGLRYILKNSDQEKGYLVDKTTTIETHNHGYGLLFLATAYGSDLPVELSQSIKKLIPRAIGLTLKGQAPNGGWGYSLVAKNLYGLQDEGSATVTQVQALRACRNAGFSVSKEAVERAVKYIERCQMESGGFMYSLSNRKVSMEPEHKVPSFAVTAASLATLVASGTEPDPLVKRGVKYLDKYIEGDRPVEWFYYYGHFYAAQVRVRMGGSHWRAYYSQMREELPRYQGPDGAWRSSPSKTDRWEIKEERYGVPILTSAFALIVLQMPRKALPFLVDTR